MTKKEKKEKIAIVSKRNNAAVTSTEQNSCQKEIAITMDALVFTLQKYAHAAVDGENCNTEETGKSNSMKKSKKKNSRKTDKVIKVEINEKLPSLVIEKSALGKESEKRLLLEKFFRSFQRHLTIREMEMILLRYLISDKFEISKTIDNCIKTAEFRRREHLHRMLLFPSLIPLRGYDELSICKTLKLQYGADTSEPPFTLSLSGLPINDNEINGAPTTSVVNTMSASCTPASQNKGNSATTAAAATFYGGASQTFTNTSSKVCTSSSLECQSTPMEDKYKSELIVDTTGNNNVYRTNSIDGSSDNYYNVDYLALYSTPTPANANHNNRNTSKSSNHITPQSSRAINNIATNQQTLEVELPLASASLVSVLEESTVHSCLSQDNSFVNNNIRRNSTSDDANKHSHLLERILSHLPFNWRRDKEDKVRTSDVNNINGTRCNNNSTSVERAQSADAASAALHSEDNISFSHLLRNEGRSLSQVNKSNDVSSTRNVTSASYKLKPNGSSQHNNKLIKLPSLEVKSSNYKCKEQSASASSSLSSETTTTTTTTATSRALDMSMNWSEDRSEQLYREIEQATHGRGRRFVSEIKEVKEPNRISDIEKRQSKCNVMSGEVGDEKHTEVQEHSFEMSNPNKYSSSNNIDTVGVKSNSCVGHINTKLNETNDTIVPGDDVNDGDADSNIVLDYHPLLEPIISTILRHVPMTFHYWDKKGHPVIYCKFAMLRSRLLTEELFRLTPLGSEPVALCALFQAYTLEVVQQLIRFKDYQNMSFNEMSKALELPCNANNRLNDANHTTPTNTPTTTNNNNKNDGFDRNSNTRVLPERSHVETCVVVLDCANVQYRHLLYRPLLRMMRAVVKLSQEHWPELLHHIYVVNCHKIIRLAYLLIKNTLMESTRRKITFCDRQYTSLTLREVIDKEFLPQEYGGSCNCMGGCLNVGSTSLKDDDEESSSATVSSMQTNTLRDNVSPTLGSPREEDEISWVSERSSRQLSKRQASQMSFARDTHFSRTARKFIIRPRQRQSMMFAVNSKEEVIWEFAVKRRRLVSFSAVFIPADGGGAIYSLAASRKVFEDANHYVCPCAGTIIFKWKNEVYFGHRAHLHVKVYRDDFAND